MSTGYSLVVGRQFAQIHGHLDLALQNQSSSFDKSTSNFNMALMHEKAEQ